MSMGPQQSMEQRTALVQTVSQRMIQTMEFLQLQEQQLEERITQELEKNPVLELDDSSDKSDDEKDTSSDQEPDNRTDKREEKRGEEIYDVDDYYESQADNQYDEERPIRSRNALDNESEYYLDFLQSIPDRTQTLQDHLLEQLRWFDYPDKIRRYTEELIYNLDRSGYLRLGKNGFVRKISEKDSKEERSEYLRSVLKDIFARKPDNTFRELSPMEWNDIERALHVLQSFDPKGIGARDLQECLLLQITDQMKDADKLRVLVMNHLDDLEKNRFPQISRQMNISFEQIQSLLAQLRQLNPRPGADFNEEQNAPIIPDVYVEKKDGCWEIRTASGLSEKLKISPDYQQMAAQKKIDNTVKKYLRDNISSARWLMEMVEQRKKTLLNVSREIIDYQRAFLEEGPEKIRPLTLQDIAERLGINTSTVSRACSNKWMQTPQGLFSFKRFFSGAVPAAGEKEDVLAQQAVLAKLQEYIRKENKKNPLSDDELEKKFESDNIKISRRTIAKYRTILKIPNSRERRNW